MAVDHPPIEVGTQGTDKLVTVTFNERHLESIIPYSKAHSGIQALLAAQQGQPPTEPPSPPATEPTDDEILVAFVGYSVGIETGRAVNLYDQQVVAKKEVAQAADESVRVEIIEAVVGG